MSQYTVSQPWPAGKQEVYLRIRIGSVDRLSTNKADLILIGKVSDQPGQIQYPSITIITPALILFFMVKIITFV